MILIKKILLIILILSQFLYDLRFLNIVDAEDEKDLKNIEIDLKTYKEEKVDILQQSMQQKDEVSQLIREKLNVDVGEMIDKSDVDIIQSKIEDINLSEKEKQLLQSKKVVDFVPIYDDKKDVVLQKVFDPDIVSDGQKLTTENTSYDVEIPLDQENFNTKISIDSKLISGADINQNYDVEIIPIRYNNFSGQISYIDNVVIYKDFLPNIDKIQTIEKDGIKEDLIIKKSNKKGYYTFLYLIRTKKLDLIEGKNGELDFINKDGNSVMFVPPPFFIDFNGKKSHNTYYEIINDFDINNIYQYFDIKDSLKRVFEKGASIIYQKIKRKLIDDYMNFIKENTSKDDVSFLYYLFDNAFAQTSDDIIDDSLNNTDTILSNDNGYTVDVENLDLNSQNNDDLQTSTGDIINNNQQSNELNDNQNKTDLQISTGDIIKLNDDQKNIDIIQQNNELNNDENNNNLQLQTNTGYITESFEINSEKNDDLSDINEMSNEYWKNIITNKDPDIKEYLVRLVVVVDDNDYVYPIDVDPTIKIRLFAKNNNTQFAYGESIGYIATYTPFAQSITIYDNYIKGWLWSSAIGYIKLNSELQEKGPYLNTNTGNYGINISPILQENIYAPRALTGYAYSQEAGFIIFSNDADGSVTPYQNQDENDFGVYLLSGGILQGFAWSDTFGWIAFNYSGINVTLDEVKYSISTGTTTNDHITTIQNNYTGVNILTFYGVSSIPCTSTGYGVNQWYIFTSGMILNNADGYICYKTVYGTGANYVEIYDSTTNIVYNDQNPPVSTASIISGTLGQNNWYISSVLVGINVSDDKTGVLNTKYCIDSNNSCEPNLIYTGNILFLDSGIKYLRYKSTDNANNVENTKFLQIKIDKDFPALSANKSNPNSWYNTSQIITINGFDQTSGLYQMKYRWDAVADANNGTLINNGNQINFDMLGNHILYLWASDNAGNVSTWSGTYRLDNVSPNILSTTLLYPNGGESFGGGNLVKIQWNSGSITDSISGLSNNPIKLEYSTGSTWNTIVASTENDGIFDWILPDITSSTVMLRITAIDNAGNTSFDTSDAVFSINSTTNYNTLTKISGDNQLVDIYDMTKNDLVLRVSNGFNSYAKSGDVLVNFTFYEVPYLSSGYYLIGGSSGVVLSGSGSQNLSVYTDNNGFVSAKVISGDRFGEYVVKADFNGNISGPKYFVITERKIFELTISNLKSNINVNPENVSGFTESGRYITVTTNAYNFNISAVLPDLLTYENNSNIKINNWNNNFGFAWLNLDNLIPQAFSEINNDTILMNLSGSMINKQILLPPLYTKIDFLNPSGSYTGNVVYKAKDIDFTKK